MTVKRVLLVPCLLLSVTAYAKEKKPRPAPSPFTVVEATIPQMRAALEEGRVTSRELVLQYLTRIATYEDKLHAAMVVNRDALKQAEAMD